MSLNYDDKNLDYLFLLENTWFCQLINFLIQSMIPIKNIGALQHLKSIYFSLSVSSFAFSVISMSHTLVITITFHHVHLLNVNFCVLAIIGKYFFLARIRAVTTVPTLPFVYCPIKRLIDRQSKTTFTRSLLSINK